MESNISNKYDCEIEILTPVHIGSGDSYSLRECAYYNGTKKKIRSRIKLIEYYSRLPDKYKKTFLESFLKKDFNLDKFHNGLKERSKVLQEDEIVDFDLKSFVRYSFYNKTKKGNLDIMETAKTLDKIYIPGSSIKGAIKTTLIYNSINNDILRSKINNNRLNENSIKNYIENLFKDDNADISKFLHISDSSTYKYPSVYQSQQIRIAYDEETELKGIETGTKSFLETISFENSKKTNSLKTTIKMEYNKDLIKKHFEKFLDIKYITESIYNFSSDLIEYELKFARKFNLDYLINFYEDLKNKNCKEEPLLRIGAGSGLMGTSIALKIRNYDKNLFDKVYGIQDGTIYPRTRHIALSKEKPIEGVPLGWVKLKIEERK